MSVKLPDTLTDHPSLVGVIRFPCLTHGEKQRIEIPIIVNEGGTWKSVKQPVEMSLTINSASRTSNNFNVPKSKVTDFYPYTYYVLTDGECEPLIMQPQYLPNTICIDSEVALSHQPVERYFINGYKGDVKGHNYNITNLNQMMLPTATNEGISYMSANANTIMQNRKSTQMRNILHSTIGAISTIGAFASGSVGGGLMVGANTLSNTINGFNNIKSLDSRNKDIMLTPNSISSFGTPSTRDKFDNNKVRLLKYTVTDKVKNKINSFCDRYGNKYNNYGVIDIKSYKGYIKFISPNIDSNIDNIHINKLKSILERGVYCE